MPGSGLLFSSLTKQHWSPATNTLANEGTERSLLTITRPARSHSNSLFLPSSEASVPAAHKTVDAQMRSFETSTPDSFTPVTLASVHVCTPSASRSRIARLANPSENIGKILGPASIKIIRACFGSMCLKSFASVNRLISPRAPANSTPVGPAPTTTNVKCCRRWTESSVSSAFSNASNTRRRISVACSRVLRPGALASHCAFPK